MLYFMIWRIASGSFPIPRINEKLGRGSSEFGGERIRIECSRCDSEARKWNSSPGPIPSLLGEIGPGE
jgi:hypothetical protein